MTKKTERKARLADTWANADEREVQAEYESRFPGNPYPGAKDAAAQLDAQDKSDPPLETLNVFKVSYCFESDAVPADGKTPAVERTVTEATSVNVLAADQNSVAEVLEDNNIVMEGKRLTILSSSLLASKVIFS